VTRSLSYKECCLFSWFFFAALLVQVSVQANPNTIQLEPGLWEYKQNTTIQGAPFYIPKVSGTECVTKQASENSLNHYIEKFQQGLGNDSNCTISNLINAENTALFRLQCQPILGISSDHQIEYKYAKTRVDIKSAGVLSTGGLEFHISTNATSVWKRKCTGIENADRSREPKESQNQLETERDKRRYRIGTNGAGPISGSLLFSEKVIQYKFPGSKVERVMTELYERKRFVFKVIPKGETKPVFQIDDRQGTNASFSVFTTHPKAVGPFGEKVGETRLGEVSTNNPHLCAFSEDKESRDVICLTSGVFRTIYAIPDHILKKYSDVIPQTEINQAVLKEMRYFLNYPKNYKVFENLNQEQDSEPAIIKISAEQFVEDMKDLSVSKPVVVHFTSNDGSCSHCVKNNKAFRDAAAKLSGDYIFAEVIFNPWRKYLKNFKQLGGLPNTQVFIDDSSVLSISGFKAKLARNIQREHKKISKILERDYSRVDIPQVSIDIFSALIKQDRGDKLLLVHITSSDTDCKACEKNNAFFRNAFRKHHKKFDFAEMIIETKTSIKDDPTLKNWLLDNNINLKNLPLTMMYQYGKPLGGRADVWPTMSLDLKKWAAKQQ